MKADEEAGTLDGVRKAADVHMAVMFIRRQARYSDDDLGEGEVSSRHDVRTVRRSWRA